MSSNAISRFMKGGRIVERGTHQDLLRVPNGEYAKLYEAQVSKQLPSPETTVLPWSSGAFLCSFTNMFVMEK